MPTRREMVVPHWRDALLWRAGELPLWVRRWTHRSTYPEHDHDFLELVLVMGGDCTNVSVLGETMIRSGDMILMRPGTWHALLNPNALDIWLCCFGRELLQHELLWTRQDPALRGLLWGVGPGHDVRGVNILRMSATGRHGMDVIFKRLWNFQRINRRSHRAARIGLLLEALDRVSTAMDPSESPSSVSPVVSLAAERLQDRCAEEWTLDRLTDELRVNKFHLARQFRAGLGVSPMAYLNRVRAEMAAALVRDTPRPIGDIGVAVGWPVAAHFSRRFRAHLGMSAADYRRRFARPARLRGCP